MSITYQLRPVSPRDAEALQETCWQNWSIEAVKDLLERVEGISKRSRGLGIVAYNDHTLLGYGQLTIWPRTTEISDLIVSAPYRSNGIGTAIICHLINKVRAWHLPQVEIGVAMSNPRAHELYLRLGFQQDRIINLDLGSGPEPVVYLTMNLESYKGRDTRKP
ncbi:MAG: GNAT family N-acetyltransferase [Anaerolineae bacterium]|nr:GNAT family N-acetyltransferase [Anaerolineae bacterium]